MAWREADACCVRRSIFVETIGGAEPAPLGHRPRARRLGPLSEAARQKGSARRRRMRRAPDGATCGGPKARVRAVDRAGARESICEPRLGGGPTPMRPMRRRAAPVRVRACNQGLARFTSGNVLRWLRGEGGPPRRASACSNRPRPSRSLPAQAMTRRSTSRASGSGLVAMAREVEGSGICRRPGRRRVVARGRG